MASTDEHAAQDTLHLPEEEMLRPDEAQDAAAAGADAKPSGAELRWGSSNYTVSSSKPAALRWCSARVEFSSGHSGTAHLWQPVQSSAQ